MPNAYNNVRGWVRDLRALRQAAYEGDKGAGELLDAVCDELDVLIEFGSDDDAVGDVGHDEGSDDAEGLAESELDVPRGTQLPLPANRAGTRRVASQRGGVRTAILTDPHPPMVRLSRGNRKA